MGSEEPLLRSGSRYPFDRFARRCGTIPVVDSEGPKILKKAALDFSEYRFRKNATLALA